MKVVINRCFGGFGLSIEAVLLYAKKKGKPCWYEPDKRFHSLDMGTFWIVPEGQRPPDLTDKWLTLTITERQKHNEAWEAATISVSDISRSDPQLVEVIEELGDKANTRFSELKVVDVPDGVEWEIEEYDGSEWVSEKHRIWR